MKNILQRIRDAVSSRNLPAQFRAAQVSSILGIDFAGSFLVKRCQGHMEVMDVY